MPTDKKTYLSNGRVLEAPPITVRINRAIESIYLFIGLYLVSFFSVCSTRLYQYRVAYTGWYGPAADVDQQLDPYKAARYSQYNISEPKNDNNMRPRWGGSSGGASGYGGGGGGPSGDGAGGGPRRMGRVDDVRAPECGSCG